MTEERLGEKFIFYNPWWRQKQVSGELALPFRRKIFSDLISYLSLDRVIVLKGPRRTGKSTLMYQMVQYLLEKGVSAEAILYLNFEDPLLRENLDKLLLFYEKLSLESLESKQLKYIFLDEVHLLPGWALSVKAFFDKKYHLKFISSGSASSLIQRSTESLAGRTIEEIILPFTFREFVDYKRFVAGERKSIETKNYLFFKKEIELYWEKYLKHGGFAHLLNIDKPEFLQKLVYEDVVQKVIYKDLVDLYGIREPAVLEKVFYYLHQTSGQILNLSNLSAIIGINRETLRSYLTYLRQAFLYFELPKFSRSVKQMLGSAQKIHMIDPAFFILTPQMQQPFILESVVARHFFQKYSTNLYYWREREEVDLIVQKDDDLIPIEVKTASGVTKNHLKGVFKFLKRFKQKEGWVIYAGEDKEEIVDNKIIKFFSAPKKLYFEF